MNPKQQDPAFYQVDNDPQIVWDDGGRFYVERVGEMRIVYTDPDGKQSILRTTEDLFSIGITTDGELVDYTLKGEDVFSWVHNSWFEIVDREQDEYLDDVYYSIDDAIEAAKENN